MKKIGRREFLVAAVAMAGLHQFLGIALFKDWHPATIADASAPDDTSSPLRVIRSLTPTSQVPLGKSGIKVSMVGLGTGSIGWAPSIEPDQARTGRIHQTDASCLRSRHQLL